MLQYEIRGKKGEGTFSEVLTGELPDGTFCAVKRMKAEFKSWEQVNQLREVQALRRLNPHPNIIDMLSVNYDPATRRLDLVCELMEMNIYERIKGRKHHLPEELVKSYTFQLCKALDHMHRNGIFHRDVKPENVLIRDEVLKLADFGSCRGIYSKPPFTEYISTRWYRPPECLLTDGHYSFKMDMWSVGCVFFETMSLYPLFPGANEVDQINKIHDVLGTPAPEVLEKMQTGSNHTKFSFDQKEGSGLARHLPKASSDCLSLMAGLLKYDPEERFSARQALKHPYFKDLRDADKRARQKQKLGATGGADGGDVETMGAAAGPAQSTDSMNRTGGKRNKQKQMMPPLPNRGANGANQAQTLPPTVTKVRKGPPARAGAQAGRKGGGKDVQLPPIMFQTTGPSTTKVAKVPKAHQRVPAKPSQRGGGFAQLPSIDKSGR